MSVQGRKVLLTGAAGGLGTAMARALLHGGARLIAVDIDEAKNAQLEAALGAEEGPGSWVLERLDIGDGEGWRAGLEALIEREGGLDIVVNNAAVYPSRAIEDYALDDWRKVNAVNVEAAVIAVECALPGMRERGVGRIVSISSITAFGGWAKLAPYVTSKAAIIGLTRAWARELGAHGITANAIAPGAFPTDAEKIHPDLEGYTRFVLDHQAVKRRGDPADIANAVLFFASEATGFITGQTLIVDGGWVMN